MRADLIILALAVGLGTYLFRLLPMHMGKPISRGDGFWSRFIAATGPAAIATLFVASIMPLMQEQPLAIASTFAGSAATVLLYVWRRNVVLATLSGALVYGLVFQMFLPALGTA